MRVRPSEYGKKLRPGTNIALRALYTRYARATASDFPPVIYPGSLVPDSVSQASE